MFHYLPYRYQAIVLNVLQVLLQSEIGLETEVYVHLLPQKSISESRVNLTNKDFQAFMCSLSLLIPSLLLEVLCLFGDLFGTFCLTLAIFQVP